MSGLEGIVRPFQRANTLATRRLIASNTKIDVPPATITWGQAGNLPSAQQIAAIDPTGTNFTVIICDDQFSEVSRKEDTRRITQTFPDGTTNPDNFVDINRPYQMTFKKDSETEAPRNETQTWSDAFDTAQFRTVNFNNRMCKNTYNLNRSLS